MTKYPLELQDFINKVDEIVSTMEDRTMIVAGIKPLMQELISTDFLPEKYRTPCASQYARNLIHRSPFGYVLIAMVWGKGQGTPIHDHDNTWGVVGVYEGKVRVEDYEVVEDMDEWAKMRVRKSTLAGKGNMGYLVKSDERHTIGNAQNDVSISLHCYGKDIKSCNVWEYDEEKALYHRMQKNSAYTTE